jgi:protein TonB
MMTVLLESAGARGPKRAGWTIASISMHVALIAGAIILTTQAPAIVDEPVTIIPIVPYVPPQPREPALTHPGQAPLPGAPSIPSLPIPLPIVPTFDSGQPFTPSVGTGDIFARPVMPITSRGPVATGGVHTSAGVERIASLLPGNGSPVYPRALRTAGVEGSVVVTFVVDTAGRAEPSSITIVSATHTLFADAVRQWLARTRYAPAEIGGKRVRQLVQQEVGFRLND